MLSDLIERYEDRTDPPWDVSDAEMLRFLMELCVLRHRVSGGVATHERPSIILRGRFPAEEDEAMKARMARIMCKVELQPGEKLSLPEALIESIGAGSWTIIVQSADDTDEAIRNHSAFLGSYSPADEGLYDDCQRR